MKVLFSVLVLSLFFGCQGKKGEVVTQIQSINGPFSEEIKALIDNNETIQRDIAESTILTSTTNEQVDNFKVFLISSRRNLVVLLDNPSNSRVLKSLEIEVLSAENFPIAVRDQSYITPYIKRLKALIGLIYMHQGAEAENYAANFIFSKENSDKLIRVKEDTAADFQARTSERGDYMSIDSFRKKNNGKVSLISPSFSIDELNYIIRFEYLVRFYKPNARAERLIKFYVGENQESIDDIVWKDLDVELGADAGGFGDDPSVTEEKELNLFNTDIRVKIEYSSSVEKEAFPALNLYSIQIVEKN